MGKTDQSTSKLGWNLQRVQGPHQCGESPGFLCDADGTFLSAAFVDAINLREGEHGTEDARVLRKPRFVDLNIGIEQEVII
jgi:hypothetical protein